MLREPMWWSAGLAIVLFGCSLMIDNVYVKMFLIIASMPFFLVWNRLWQEKKQAKDDADARQLGRLIGAEYDKTPCPGFLDQFQDNPWDVWPKFSGDLEVGRVLRATGETPAFYIIDVHCNKKNRDEDLAAYTVTLVVIPLRKGLDKYLERWMVPEGYEAVPGTTFLYLYRAATWRSWGEGMALPVDDIPAALSHATDVAAALERAARRT